MELITPNLFNWASILDQETRNQAIKTAMMPFIYPHLALMPDAHLGKGATVGSVIPTIHAIMPAAVGVDIGCGMIAVRTQFTTDDVAHKAMTGHPLSELREYIEGSVPLSPGRYNDGLYDRRTRKRVAQLESLPGAETATKTAGNWHLQLGSLGGGNHFIEVVADELNRVWAFLHSGSRGVGNRLANKHIKVAKQLRVRDRMPDKDLAWLDEVEPQFWDYIEDLTWAQEFALLNREEMMDRVLDCLQEYLGSQVREFERINCHHNYTEKTKIGGDTIWLSRKGAIAAYEGTLGLIPGSMGTRSYVVKGKGNPMALWSSPHGAGREYSRTAARHTFTMDELEAAMVGIEWRRTDAFLDEIPQAYKPIDVVMEDSADLVEPIHEFRQLLNVKGE